MRRREILIGLALWAATPAAALGYNWAQRSYEWNCRRAGVAPREIGNSAVALVRRLEGGERPTRFEDLENGDIVRVQFPDGSVIGPVRVTNLQKTATNVAFVGSNL